MTPKFNNFEKGFGAELVCPSCESTYLHQEVIDIYERGEDDTHGVHVTVAGLKATFDTSLVGNPSARRDGLVIRFSCEGCKATPVLTVKQHKGNTYFDLSAE